MKIYDKRSKMFQMEWIFQPLLEDQTEEFVSQGNFPVNTPKVIANLEKGLEYDQRLLVASAAGESSPDKVKFKIELPEKVKRGEKIKISVFPPTVVHVKAITVLIGLSNYIDLEKKRDGSFVGYFNVPDIYEYGTYVASFYIRLTSGERTIRQHTLRVIPFSN